MKRVLIRVAWVGASLALVGLAALGDEGSVVRVSAAILLAWVKDSRALAALTDALKDKESAVRREAANALGQLGKEGVLPLTTVLQDADWRVRWAAAGHLGRMREPRAVEALIAALRAQRQGERNHFDWALGRITGEDLGKSPDAWQEWWDRDRDRLLNGT